MCPLCHFSAHLSQRPLARLKDRRAAILSSTDRAEEPTRLSSGREDLLTVVFTGGVGRGRGPLGADFTQNPLSDLHKSLNMTGVTTSSYKSASAQAEARSGGH